MTALDMRRVAGLSLALGYTAATIAGTLALDSVYTYGSAGDGVAFRFVSPVTDTLAKVKFYVSARTGSPGNLSVVVRNSASATIPGTSVLASQTVAEPGAAGRWVECVFSSPPSLVKGTLYFVTVFDAAGTGVNHSTVQHGSVCGGDTFRSASTLNSNVQSTNGFTSGNAGNGACWCATFTGGTKIGNPYTTSTSLANTSFMKGLYVPRLPFAGELCGISASTMASVTKLRVYEGAYEGQVIPASPTFERDIETFAANAGACLFETIPLKSNRPYLFAFVYSGSVVPFTVAEIGDYERFSDMPDFRFMEGAKYMFDASGEWDVTENQLPRIALFFSSVGGTGDNAPIAGPRGGFIG